MRAVITDSEDSPTSACQGQRVLAIHPTSTEHVMVRDTSDESEGY